MIDPVANDTNRTAREDVLRRLFALPWRDQYEVHRVIGSYLQPGGGRETKTQKNLRERAEMLDAMQAAANHHGLKKGQAPTLAEYSEAAAALGLPWSASQIVRRWDGYWDDARAALTRSTLGTTAKQRAVRRATSGRTRSHEDYLAGVREWLTSKPPPPQDSAVAYDDWVDEENQRRDESESLPLVQANTLARTLLVPWDLTLAVARFEMELAAAQVRHLQALTKASGDLGIIGTTGVAIMLSKSLSYTNQLTTRPSFPVHVLELGSTRAWYRSDIEAHRDDRPVPVRHRNELAASVIASADVCRKLNMRPDTLIAYIHRDEWHRVPQPTGSVSGRNFWLRSEVEKWFEERAKAPAKPAVRAAQNAKNSG